MHLRRNCNKHTSFPIPVSEVEIDLSWMRTGNPHAIEVRECSFEELSTADQKLISSVLGCHIG